MKLSNAVLMSSLGVLLWTNVHADQSHAASTTLRVSATVNAVCEVTATDLVLGTSTSHTVVPLPGTRRLRATCSPSATYDIRPNEGRSPEATVDPQRVVSGAQAPDYRLHSDAQRSTIWGYATASDTANGVGTGFARDHPLSGTTGNAAPGNPALGNADTTIVRIYY